MAISLKNEAMKALSCVPTGWWEKHIGVSFILPFTEKSSFRNAVRKKLLIMDDLIYPYHYSRDQPRLKTSFELTRENGCFIGLFLAEGNNDRSNIRISNNDLSVQTFVRDWFTKNGIQCHLDSKTNTLGTSFSIRGYSTLHAHFLTCIVGSGAAQKYVPDFAFCAPDEFIIGLLDGYFSGDGCVTKYIVKSSSVSPRLTEGIAMLCSRLSIFARISKTQQLKNNLGTVNILPTYHINITGQNAKRFAEKVNLIIPSKNEKLKNMKPSPVYSFYPEQCDVVLDGIKSIETIGVENHPKMYDVTVPSTKNFGVAEWCHTFAIRVLVGIFKDV